MKVGDKFKVDMPCKYMQYTSQSFFGLSEDGHWQLGCHIEQEGDESFARADGMGFVEFEVLAIVEMPRKIKTRVLYKYNTKLTDTALIKGAKVYTESIDCFNNRLKGYKHEYTIED